MHVDFSLVVCEVRDVAHLHGLELILSQTKEESDLR